MKKKQAVRLPRAEHDISRKLISENALKVLYRLRDAGFDAYLVGGGVRDLLLGRRPKDFDIVTNATPQQIRHIIHNSRIIGRRFQLVHAYFKRDIIEVSTFRASVSPANATKRLPDMMAADNTFGSISDDAFRRDFTVNALFYDISDFSVVDYTGGLLDLEHRTIRVIGDPFIRFREDPVRMLRAIRLAAKLEFTIEPKTEAALIELLPLLEHVPQARLFDELQKIFFNGYAKVTFDLLRHYQVFGFFFPETKQILQLTTPHAKQATAFIDAALKASDERFAKELAINPGFLMAVFLWPVVQDRMTKKNAQIKKLFQALHESIQAVLDHQLQIFAIPKRFIAMMQSVWLMQYHLERRRGLRVLRVVNHRYFRAAFDFLILRAEVGQAEADLVVWWKAFYAAPEAERYDLVKQLTQEKGRAS